MAEAILVMTILGIIATVMITVMKPAQYKKKALKIKTTKVINDIDQATEFILLNDSKDGTLLHLIAENGSEFSANSSFNKINSDRLASSYKKYLQTSRKECNNETCICYKNTQSYNRGKMSYFYLKDGACVALRTGLANTENEYSIFPNEGIYDKELAPVLKDVWGGILLDVNGKDEPNTYGEDTFILRFSDTGIAWDAEIVEE